MAKDYEVYFGNAFEYTTFTVDGDTSDGYHTFDYIYVTALGYYESEGMGSYKDMDALNIGSVFEKEIEDILVEYGGPIFKTIPIQKKLSLNNK